MKKNFDLESFIKKHVTHRTESLLLSDLDTYRDELSRRLENRKVLVIGGAGTIGSSYIKALLQFRIAKLVVVDTNENGLTELVRDLRSSSNYHIPAELITYPVNFGDKVFEKLFHHHGPFQVVANFAAHKHVRSEKDVYSIEAMIDNNVIRARKLLELLLQNPPEHFFCVSTDKAANPVNVMGASKKLMEELIMAYADRIPIKTARFANVAFSNGSLPLGFLDRIAKKQPWSCPLGIRRFFVSPQESGELCLMASIMGESGDIFYPRLDEDIDMIPFDTIALDLLRELGLEADVCSSDEEARIKAHQLNENATRWPVYFFQSDTSGEKTFEEFFTDNEQRDESGFTKLGVVKNSKKRDREEIDNIIAQLTALFQSDTVTKEAIVSILRTYLPNFEHIETGKGLDSKM